MSWLHKNIKKTDERPSPSMRRAWLFRPCRFWTVKRMTLLVIVFLVVVVLRYRHVEFSAADVFGLYSGHSWPSDDPVSVRDYMRNHFALEAIYWNYRKPDAPKSKINLEMFGNLDTRTIPLKQALVYSTSRSRLAQNHVGVFFSKQRFDYVIASYSDPLPSLVMPGTNRPMFSVIVFDDILEYFNMAEEDKEVIDDYCRKYSVGILGMTRAGGTTRPDYTFGDLRILGRQALKGYKKNEESSIWRVGKSAYIHVDDLGNRDWTVFLLNHRTYKPLIWSTLKDPDQGSPDAPKKPFSCVIAYHDVGLKDGIEKIVFGNSIDHWLNTISAMDAVGHMSHGRLQLPLERYIQVEIEQMFVGPKGIRTKAIDAQAMVSSQTTVERIVPGIKYVLGYCSSTFGAGTKDEEDGDKKIVEELGKNFVWMNQLVSFEKVSTKPYDDIVKDLKANFEFAKKRELPVLQNYVVTPRYEGIYPVYQPLYKAFEALGINSSSTEVYPHLYSEHSKRGFLHNGVRVMPRWHCGVPKINFNFLSELRHIGGKETMDHIVKKGDFFKKFLFNPVLLLASKMGNFANDRLGAYSVEHATRLVSTYTNLKLMGPEPASIVDIYFQQHPEELKPPFWQNPCAEVTHKNMVSNLDQCRQIPDVFIIGPPLTGAANLALFLSIHPEVLGAKENKDIHFFEDSNYVKGLDWYTDHFPMKPDDREKHVIMELDTEYFMSYSAPARMEALNPDVKVIVTTVDPVLRAYAWYLYCKTKEVPAALEHSFYDVVTATSDATQELRELRDMALLPGLYANHVARFMYALNRTQVLVLDGDAMGSDPAPAMDSVQRFLKISMDDYKGKLKYSEDSGTFCTSKTCAQPQIDTSAETMDKKSEGILREFYKGSNLDLKSFMEDDFRERVPTWLEDATGRDNKR